MSVIVSVQRDGQDQVYDLEVSTELPAGELAENIAIIFGWKQTGIFYDLEMEATGTLLSASESLAQANAWDGSHLILRQRGEQAVRLPGQKRAEARKENSVPAAVQPGSKKPIQTEVSQVFPPASSTKPAPGSGEKTVETPQNPMRGWKKLDLPAAQTDAPEEETPKQESKFHWKRIDED